MQFEEADDGSWVPERDQELDEGGVDELEIQAMMNDLEEIEAEADGTARTTEDNPFPHLPFFKQLASGNLNLEDIFLGT
jgi:hypothetical protein